jgi:hypothetical protein
VFQIVKHYSCLFPKRSTLSSGKQLYIEIGNQLKSGKEGRNSPLTLHDSQTSELLFENMEITHTFK